MSQIDCRKKKRRYEEEWDVVIVNEPDDEIILEVCLQLLEGRYDKALSPPAKEGR